MARITGFDHLVLVVDDVERTLAWYTALGLAPERVEEWRRGELFFPSLRISPTSLIDVLPGRQGDGRNVDHFCLVVDDDVAELATSGKFDVVDGPDTRWGAQGNATSLYVRDPDGNVVELRKY